MTKLTLSTLGAAAIGLALTTAPATANDSNQPPERAISIAGIDLSSAEGQRILDQRIERAARAVCGLGAIRTGTRIRSNKARQCLTRARASAQRQVAAAIASQQRGG